MNSLQIKIKSIEELESLFQDVAIEWVLLPIMVVLILVYIVRRIIKSKL
ncbi:MAG: hypothetical protein E6772_09730 [Dysgonomonas sp.]|nr:hypothetical protein [Dysgonomonas sp.]